ncbi:universal stress protein [Desulforamulus hydrothermalis]|uniref:UspA domain protein n=1 Tax=Desulforamulus hydrothermalis Lam5 = DSM 18033 TaxID=1121428 RepID=K8EE53_9FIRM|nr:universal stress protein [Desulforamulus hydrothermalis]CCO07076.1 UspA domain protein [Desulforamulus hydrothermalis Lam5 = DSM 18033]SHH40744.1 Nucleotide-binding universal stress protein, UspA family [Desulforamulus hydrothermalis Lam5 = DSM 18033]
MFNNILVAVHGDEKEAFWAKIEALIMLTKPEVTVLHVSETGLTHYGYVDQLASGIAKEQFIEYIYQMAEEKQQVIYQKIKELSQRAGINFMWQVRRGSPAKEISSELSKGSYDLLILGTKPKSLGNTSSKVKENLLKHNCVSLLILQ